MRVRYSYSNMNIPYLCCLIRWRPTLRRLVNIFYHWLFVLGFATRLSALGLLIMTAVIQVFVYPESWSVHILWAAILVYLIKHGGGKISLDHLLNKKYSCLSTQTNSKFM